jgi:hypothetical protein
VLILDAWTARRRQRMPSDLPRALPTVTVDAFLVAFTFKSKQL